MPNMRTIEVWVAMNEDGKHEAGTDRAEAGSRLHDAYGPRDMSGEPIRMLCITLTVPAPEVINLAATVPAEDAEVELKIT